MSDKHTLLFQSKEASKANYNSWSKLSTRYIDKYDIFDLCPFRVNVVLGMLLPLIL